MTKFKKVKRQNEIVKLKNFSRTIKNIVKNSAVNNYVSQLIFARIYIKIRKEIIANVYNLEEKLDLNDYLDCENIVSNCDYVFYCNSLNSPKFEATHFIEFIFTINGWKLNFIVYETRMSFHLSRHNDNVQKSIIYKDNDNYASLNTTYIDSSDYFRLVYKFKDFRKKIRNVLFVDKWNVIDKFIEKLIENIITDNKLAKK